MGIPSIPPINPIFAGKWGNLVESTADTRAGKCPLAPMGVLAPPHSALQFKKGHLGGDAESIKIKLRKAKHPNPNPNQTNQNRTN